MRVLPLLVVSLSLVYPTGLATAQAPAIRTAAAKPASTLGRLPRRLTTAIRFPSRRFPQGPPSKAGLELKAIHQADTKWRESQRGAQPTRLVGKIQPTIAALRRSRHPAEDP